MLLSLLAAHSQNYPTQGIKYEGYEGYLNGKKLLEETNDMFTQEGSVGLWTKADAVTSFDDLSVKPLK